MEVESTQKLIGNHTYIFPAPSRLNSSVKNERYSSSTETAVGILCSCVAFSLVLLFLWKVVERNKESIVKKNTSEHDKDSSIGEGDIVSKNPDNSTEFLEPSVPRCQLNFGEKEICHGKFSRNGDQGYFQAKRSSYRSQSENTSKCLNRTRLIPTQSEKYLLCDYKSYLEIESCDAREMLLNLKSDRIALWNRTANRNAAIKRACLCMDECFQALKSVKKCMDEAVARRGRRKKQVFRRRNINADDRLFATAAPYMKWVAASKESFGSVHCWLRELKSQSVIKEVLENLHCLREGHRKDSESDIRGKVVVVRSTCAIKDCKAILDKARTRMQELEDEKFVRLLHTSCKTRQVGKAAYKCKNTNRQSGGQLTQMKKKLRPERKIHCDSMHCDYPVTASNAGHPIH